MGIQELEWIDVGDGADGRSVKRQGERRKSSADERSRRQGERRQTDRLNRMDREKGDSLQRESRAVRRAQENRNIQRRQSGGRTAYYMQEVIAVPEDVFGNGVTIRPRRKLTPEERLRRKKKRRRARVIRSMMLATTFLTITVFLFGIAKLANYIYGRVSEGKEAQKAVSVSVKEITVPPDNRKWGKFYAAQLEQPEMAVDLLTINEYSRPGEMLPEVKNIFVHYTANAGTTAEQNKSYFQSLAETHERSASAHFIIGFDGVIVQCIPTKEIAYAVAKRNYDSISIECCYLEENGKFTKETYDTLIELTAWLLHKYELEPEDVLRHYDEGGKNCPKYYVEHEDSWQRFLQDLEEYMERAAVADR